MEKVFLCVFAIMAVGACNTESPPPVPKEVLEAMMEAYNKAGQRKLGCAKSSSSTSASEDEDDEDYTSMTTMPTLSRNADMETEERYTGVVCFDQQYFEYLGDHIREILEGYVEDPPDGLDSPTFYTESNFDMDMGDRGFDDELPGSDEEVTVEEDEMDDEDGEEEKEEEEEEDGAEPLDPKKQEEEWRTLSTVLHDLFMRARQSSS